jgi:hypothetical protein
MQKETKVLLIKITLGRGAARHCPLMQDQKTNIFSIEDKGNNHGYVMEMIPAIRKFGCYHTVVKLPNGEELIGNIFYSAKDYTAIADTPLIRKGLILYLKKLNESVDKALKTFQKPTKSIERYFESIAL